MAKGPKSFPQISADLTRRFSQIFSPSVGPASKAGWRDGSVRGSILLALIFLLVTFLLIK